MFVWGIVRFQKHPRGHYESTLLGMSMGNTRHSAIRNLGEGDYSPSGHGMPQVRVLAFRKDTEKFKKYVEKELTLDERVELTRQLHLLRMQKEEQELAQAS